MEGQKKSFLVFMAKIYALYVSSIAEGEFQDQCLIHC